jgi:hypothetical protein
MVVLTDEDDNPWLALLFLLQYVGPRPLTKVPPQTAKGKSVRGFRGSALQDAVGSFADVYRFSDYWQTRYLEPGLVW